MRIFYIKNVSLFYLFHSYASVFQKLKQWHARRVSFSRARCYIRCTGKFLMEHTGEKFREEYRELQRFHLYGKKERYTQRRVVIIFSARERKKMHPNELFPLSPSLPI